MVSDENSWRLWASIKTKAKEVPYESLTDSIYQVKSTAYATPQVATAFVLGSLTTLGVVAVHRRYFKRIPTADWIHPRMIAKKKWIKGVVTSVGDGDGFRLYHTPGLFWRWPMKLRKVPVNAKDLKDETISIRLAGVDAPEAAHFGREAQPYSSEALAWLKKEIEGRRIWVQLIRRDQYSRVVSLPVYPPRIPFFNTPASRCVSIAMLSAGYATTYEQSGAEYGRWGKETFLQYEEAARAAKRGMWKSGKVLETPAEYKKRHREGGLTAATISPETPSEKNSSSRKKINFTWRSFILFWR